jgi:hypothetical protein
MEGDIVLSFRREPDYFLGCAVQGEHSQIIKCTDTLTGRIVGLGARHVASLFVNGRATRVGYLSDLRADASVRRRTLLGRGYARLRELHDADPLPLYFSIILEGNRQAIASLSGARAGLPVYEDHGQILTPAIHLDRRLPQLQCKDIEMRRGNDAMAPRIFEFLREELSKKQLAPCYDAGDLRSARLLGLQAEDFYLAIRGDNIVGCVAAWDQSAFRQTHVERYSGRLRLIRPFYNLAAALSPLHSLPRPGEQIRFLYLSLIAVDGNRPDIFASLMRSVYQDRRAGAWQFMIAGLHEQDPLCAVFEDYSRIEAAGRLFLIYYAEHRDFVNQIDTRIPYVEMAAV